jgi:hypothetical protein
VHPTDRRWHFDRPPHEVRSSQQLAARLYEYPNPAKVAAG